MSKTIHRALAASFLSAAAALTVIQTDLLPEDWFQPWNEVPLPTTITDNSADRFIAKFNEAAQRSRDNGNVKPIIVPIHSNGGYITAGTRIIEAIERSDVPVILKCDRIAASMAAQILITTENVQRDASQDCLIVLHRPYLSLTNEDGTFDDFTLERLLENRQMIISLYEAEPKPLEYSLAYAYLLVLNENTRDIRNIQQESYRLAYALAESSNLDARDFYQFFHDGDRYISLSEAGVYGFIDTVDGEPLTDQNLRVGKESVCQKDPDLSICMNTPSQPDAILPQF